MTTYTYRTMTTGGLYGSDFVAESVDDAVLAAERAGYEVLDVYADDVNDTPVLVVSE